MVGQRPVRLLFILRMLKLFPKPLLMLVFHELNDGVWNNGAAASPGVGSILGAELDQDVLGALVSFKTQPVRNKHSFNPLLHSSLCPL